MKMKTYIKAIVIMLLAWICLSGCAQNQVLPKDDELPNVTVPTETEFPLASVHADWPVYQTAEELVNAATNIYTGKITDISFDIIDYKTGKSDPSNLSESRYRMLYTVYTIEVEKSYKGDNDQTEKLCLMGGVPGFNDEVQYQLARSSGLIDQYEGIPVLSFKHKKINIGESYLFCTHRSITGNHDYVINPDQFAFYKDSESSAQIQKQCMNILEKNTKE